MGRVPRDGGGAETWTATLTALAGRASAWWLFAVALWQTAWYLIIIMKMVNHAEKHGVVRKWAVKAGTCPLRTAFLPGRRGGWGALSMACGCRAEETAEGVCRLATGARCVSIKQGR